MCLITVLMEKVFNCESCVYEVYNNEKEFYECSLRNIDPNTYINKLNRKEEKICVMKILILMV